MAILLKAWNNFKFRPDIWFFHGFLLTFTLSIRKVLFFSSINGNFNEYTEIYLYLSDILLILTIAAWGFAILGNKKLKLSSCFSLCNRHEVFILSLALIVWSFLSILWSSNTSLALFRSLKLVEFTLLFLYIAYNALNKPLLRNMATIVVVMGFVQAIIGIAQVINQHSIGLFWLNESLISSSIDGVASVVLFEYKIVRAYGLLPHPNILGGFFLISIIFTLTYNKMFHVEHFKFLQSQAIISILVAIQVLALLLTFSKSAILGLFIIICYGGYKFVSRETFSGLSDLSYVHRVSTNLRESIRVKYFFRYLITTVIVFALFLTILGFNINSLLIKSFNERLLYLNVSRETIVNNPIVGIGMGQFVENMQKYSLIFLADWQYQPVHNVYLLIWSELGIIGLVLFILFLWKIFSSKVNVSHGIYVFKGILLGFIVIMLFDHYLWDIQQGQIMLWMILGLIAGNEIAENS